MASLSWCCLLLFAAICLLLHGRGAQCEYDYIVVGAGAAGCTVAPKLAASGKKVLLLEAGGPTAWEFGGRDKGASGDGSFGEIKPEDPITIFDVPGEYERLRTQRQYWWSNPPWANNGLGVGGGGMMNGALTFKPVPSDMDSWPAGWKFEDLKQSYEETFKQLFVTKTPSSDGVLYNQKAAHMFDRLAKNRLGMQEKDLNSDSNTRINTYSVPEVTARDGKRMDACLGFMLPAMESMGNLKMELYAEARRLTFDPKGQARGVVLENDRREVLLNPGGKIVLAAGTFQTARLLLASGVGPMSELERLHKYGLVRNDPSFWVVNDEVGKNLHDHTFSTITLKVPNVEAFAFRYFLGNNGEAARLMYANDQSGGYAHYGPLRLGFLSMPGSKTPDVELMAMGSGEEGSRGSDCDTCFRIFVLLLKPEARDDLLLKTPDMDCRCEDTGANPITCRTGQICKPNLYYYANDRDRSIAAWAYKMVVKAALEEGYEVLTPSNHDDNGIDQFLRWDKKSQYTGNHAGGSCQIGKCTDLSLKVKGLQNVFVADSSLLPSPVSAHNVGTVLAVAHKAADVIEAQ